VTITSSSKQFLNYSYFLSILVLGIGTAEAVFGFVGLLGYVYDSLAFSSRNFL